MKYTTILIYLLYFLIPSIGIAQQLPQYTQHMFIKLAMNPAVTGSEKYIDLGMSHRSQWGGFDGAPRTQIMYAHSSLNNKNYGFGGYIFNDRFGPVYNTGINASYAYHIPLENDIKISMGAAGSIAQLGVNGNEIKLDDETDELIDLTTISATMVPEASAGVYVYGSRFYGGFSAMHLLQSKAAVFKNLGTNAIMPYSRHYYIMGGANLGLTEEIAFIPSVLVNKAGNNPAQADFNFRFDFGMFDFGTSYRTDDAMAILTNISLLDYLEISYSYDTQISQLRRYSGGTHEMMIRYKIFYNPLFEKMFQQQQKPANNTN